MFFFRLAIAFLSCTTCLAFSSSMDAVIKDFERYVEGEREKWGVPGVAVGIVQDDQVLFMRGFGQRGLNDKNPVDAETIFQIGSLSKAFTSALISIGIDKKWFKWDDKVISHMPSFRMYDPWVTQQFEVEDLLCQRSGLISHAGDSLAILGYSEEELFKRLEYIQPVSSFRSQFAYQNIFFLVAGEILRLKTGLAFAQLVKQEIFDPLEMTQSTASLEEYLNAKNSAEWLLRLPDGSIKILPRDFTERNWTYVLGPAGGINSSLSDMVKWTMFQANQGNFKGKQLISVENMKRMHRPYIFMNADYLPAYYALGWVYMEYSPHPIIWHNGATLGAFNVVAFIPQEKLGIVVLSNVRETQLSFALALQFFDLYFSKKESDWSKLFLEKMLAKEKVKKAITPLEFYPSMPLEQYVGIYHNPLYGHVIVKKQDDHLIIEIGKPQRSLVLTHWTHDTFSLSWDIIDETNSKVYFYSDGDQLINTMEVEIFTQEGVGKFKRLSTNYD